MAWNLEVQANYDLHIIVVIDQVSKSPASYSWVISTCGSHGSVLLIRKEQPRPWMNLEFLSLCLKRVVGHYSHYFLIMILIRIIIVAFGF